MSFERSTAREALTYFWNCQTLGVSPAKPGAYRLSVNGDSLLTLAAMEKVWKDIRGPNG